MIDILIPTYDRADRMERVAANVREATTVEHRLTFALEDNDTPSIEIAERNGFNYTVNERARNYSGAINTAYKRSDASFFFAAADDLKFHPGWAEAALAKMTDWVLVVGTADLLNPYVTAGMHATHYLINRVYLDEIGGVVDEGPSSFLNEAYTHNYTDTEFIGTAKARARFQPCFDSVVEHLHALSGRGAAPDATTEKSYAHAHQDSALYDSRRHLWQDLSR